MGTLAEACGLRSAACGWISPGGAGRGGALPGQGGREGHAFSGQRRALLLDFLPCINIVDSTNNPICNL